MKNAVKWILMSLVFSGIVIGLIAYNSISEDRKLKNEGIVIWAEVVSSYTKDKYSGGRPGRSKKITVRYLNIRFRLRDGNLYNTSLEKPSEIDYIGEGALIKVIYAESDPEVLRVFRNEDNKPVFKKAARRTTRFYSAQ